MFLGPHKMQMSHYFAVSETWDFFLFQLSSVLFENGKDLFPSFRIDQDMLETEAKLSFQCF